LPELNEQVNASYSYEFGRFFMKKVLIGKITSKDLVEFLKGNVYTMENQGGDS